MSSLRRRRPAPPKSRELLLGELALVAELLDRGDVSAAIDLAEDIAAAHPGRAEPYELLVGLYLGLQDALGLERSADRLTELRPDDPEALLALVTGHVAAGRVAMALRRLDQFLERWPQEPQVPDVKALQDELQRDGLPMVIEALGLEGEHAAATALLHERVAFFSEHGRLPEARRSAERLLRENPGYVPGLNNYSQILALQGELSRSVEVAEQSLRHQPRNPHALAHLVKGHLLLGHADQAEDAWQRLIRIETHAPDWVNKQAEAGSFLGKDAEVYALKRRVEPLSALRDFPTGGYLLHLLAAAALRIGEEKEARRLWKEALRVDPGAPMAEDNLEDLKKPAGERHAPWLFTLAYWLPSQWMEKLRECGGRILQAPDEASQRTLVRRLLKDVPALRRLMPVLLQRGDPLGRSTMLVLALTQEDPETAAVLRDFALDRWGPDALRIQAAQRAVELGALDPGQVRVWSQGSSGICSSSGSRCMMKRGTTSSARRSAIWKRPLGDLPRRIRAGGRGAAGGAPGGSPDGSAGPLQPCPDPESAGAQRGSGGACPSVPRGGSGLSLCAGGARHRGGLQGRLPAGNGPPGAAPAAGAAALQRVRRALLGPGPGADGAEALGGRPHLAGYVGGDGSREPGSRSAAQVASKTEAREGGLNLRMDSAPPSRSRSCSLSPQRSAGIPPAWASPSHPNRQHREGEALRTHKSACARQNQVAESVS